MSTRPVPRSGPPSRLAVLALGGITLIGLALRLRLVGNSLFGDELSTYSIVTSHGPGQILRILDGHSVDLTPPLYFELAWLTTQLGHAPDLLRLVPLLLGTASIPLTYLVGQRTAGRPAGLVAALLMALSPFLIFYSTEARAYAPVMFLVLASTFALLEALESNRIGWWAAYAAFTCAALYTHYTAMFVLAVQLAWAVATHRDRLRGLLGANLAAAAGFAPWLPALVKNTRSFGTKVFELIEPFGVHAVSHDLAQWAVGHPYLSLGSEPGAVALGLTFAGLGAAGVLKLGRPAAGERHRGRARLVLLPLLALATPVGLGLYSLLGHSVWDMRNLISSWPGLALTAGAVLASPAPRLRLLTAGLVVTGFAIGAVQMLSPADQRPDYAAAARFILDHGGAHAPVAVITAPTPGPDAAMDAAFAYAGDPGRTLLRVGSPALQAVQAAAPYAFLPATPATSLAAQTKTAADNGTVFVVAPGRAAATTLLRSGVVDAPAVLGPVFGTGTTGRLLSSVFVPLSAYLRALDPPYVPVATRRLPGFLALSLYILQRRTGR